LRYKQRMHTLRLIFESFRFAGRALKSNILRTILSLLGVTIGIFAIIAVFTIVDALKKNITDSLSALGNGVVYVSKWPFVGGPGFRWWDYLNRPTPSYNEYRFLQATMQNAESIAIEADKGNMVYKRGNNSLGNAALVGGTFHYKDIFNVEVEKGRYFTQEEGEGAPQVALIGYEVAKALFPNDEDPLGKDIKVKALKFIVIGVIKKEGQNVFGGSAHDFSVVVPYQSFRKLYQTGTGQPFEVESMIGIKGTAEDFGLVEAENEVRGLMRSKRGIRPEERETFDINRPEAIMNAVDGVFGVLGVAGWVIGGFSILVGGFGIANIMFVSVKERTSIIGLQKSLGAKNYFILFQFLFEAIFLSLIGGLGGLLLVFLITFLPFGSLEVVLTPKNIVLGLGVASTIGMIAGIVPAAMAARLDPVIAIRSNG
jgi:putative ABC transport system permease protein